MRSCASLPKSSLLWQHMYLHCVLVYARSPPVFKRLSFWQHMLYHSAKTTLRNIYLAIFAFLAAISSSDSKDLLLPVGLHGTKGLLFLEANTCPQSHTVFLTLVEQCSYTFVRGILRERTHQLSPDDDTWAYSSTHAHRASLRTRRSSCARVALSLAACTSSQYRKVSN